MGIQIEAAVKCDRCGAGDGEIVLNIVRNGQMRIDQVFELFPGWSFKAHGKWDYRATCMECNKLIAMGVKP